MKILKNRVISNYCKFDFTALSKYFSENLGPCQRHMKSTSPILYSIDQCLLV